MLLEFVFHLIMKKYIIVVLTLFVSEIQFAQTVPIFQWADHLSYKNGISVAEGNGKVYCATKSGFFTFNKNDNSVERLSKINGLSDVNATVVDFNHFNNKAIIAYSNSNVDILDGSTIINISDIKRKNILGDKNIYGIYCLNQFAYLACGFGIVVLDMNRLEVADTYYIGPMGNALKVYDITTDNTTIYAATETGVYKALLNTANLADFTSWHKIPNLATGKYNKITGLGGKVYVNRSKFLESNITYADEIKVYNPIDSSWSNFLYVSGYTTKTLRNMNNKVVWATLDNIQLFDSIYPTSAHGTFYIDHIYNNGDLTSECAVTDVDGNVWIAADNLGLA